MRPHLLTPGEWHRLLAQVTERERRRGEFLLGTIMDVLQLAEACKKRQAIDEATFREGWAALREETGLLMDGTLTLLGLDKNALLAALFDCDWKQGDNGVSIWELANEPRTRPWRTVRRLLLRPTEDRWWDQEVFDAMEQMFGEEPDRNG